MSLIETSRCLMNRLADAGLPIPPEARYVGIRCDIDSVPVLFVESVITEAQADQLETVLKEFEFREIIKGESET